MQTKQVAFMHLGICIHVVLQMCMEQWRERHWCEREQGGCMGRHGDGARNWEMMQDTKIKK